MVSVSHPQADSFATDILSFSAHISVTCAFADDPTAAAFDETAAAIEELVLSWHSQSNRSAMAAALSTTHFRADGFRTDGGEDALSVEDDPTLTATFNFTIKGVTQDVVSN